MTSKSSPSARGSVRVAKRPATAAAASRTVADGDAAFTDGRFKRSVVTRKKIVDALSMLIRDGFLSPTAEQVASRASVGLRTVFRHFEDMETLYREIARDLDKIVDPVVHLSLSAVHWKERLFESIRIRGDLYDRIAALHLGSQALRHQSHYLNTQLLQGATRQRRLLVRQLPPVVLEDKTALESLDVATSIDIWIRLRREQGLSARMALGVVQRLVGALIAGFD